MRCSETLRRLPDRIRPVLLSALSLVFPDSAGSALAADKLAVASAPEPVAATLASEPSPFAHRGVTMGYTYSSNLAPVLKPKLKWQTQLPGMYSHEGLQAVADAGGKHLYLKAESILFKMDAETGKILWRNSGAYSGPPTIAGNALLITGPNWLKAYDLTGEKPELAWTYKTPAVFQADVKYSPRAVITVSGNLVLFGGSGVTGCYDFYSDTRLYAVDLQTGKEVWTFDSKRMVSSPIAVDPERQLCFFAGSGNLSKRTLVNKQGKDQTNPCIENNGILLAVDMTTGQEKWRAPINIVRSASGPSVADGVVYCGGDSQMMAFQVETGKELWRVPRGEQARHGVGIGPDGVALVTPECVIIGLGHTKSAKAHDRKTGKVLWTEAELPASGLRYAAGNVLYAVEYEGVMRAFDLANRKQLWERQPTSPKPKTSGLCLLDGRIVYGDFTAKLYCLENEK